MLPALLENLTDRWREPLGQRGVQLQQPLSALQIGGARGKERKVNFLVFESGGSQPVLMMKVARTTAYQGQLRHEHEALTAVWQNPALKAAVPRPLGLFMFEKRFVLLEQCVPGTSLKVLLRRQQRVSRQQVQHDCQQALAWLQQMQQATYSGIETFAGEALLTGYLERLANPLPKAFVQQLRTLAREYEGLAIPLCSRHGDYWPGNLILHKGQLGVIDWEDFLAVAWPFYDLFLFFTNYTSTYPWDGWRWTRAPAAFARAFLQDNWFSQLITSSVQQYLQRLKIPPASAALFFSLFLLERARPAADEGQKRQEQAVVWQERLQLYANHNGQSIFGEVGA
jgi:thiamine kinase-like enzyme